MAPQTSEEIDISTADMFGVWALLTLFRQRICVASAVQTLVLFCGLLTTLTAVVFSVRLTTESLDAKLQQNSWFGDPTIEHPANGSVTPSGMHRDKLSSLFAFKEEMNYTYPKNTFADLVFPNITAENLFEQYPVDTRGSGKMEVMAAIPALKLTSACSPLLANAIPLNVTVSETEFLAEVEILVDCLNGTHSNVTMPLNISETPLASTNPLPHHLYFGAALPSAQSLLVRSMACDLNLTSLEDYFEQVFRRYYVWGAWDTNRSMVDFKRLFECKYSWSEVSVETNLLWSNGELLIDSNNPPQPDKSTIKPWSPPLKVSHIEYHWGGSYSPAIFPGGFQDIPAEIGCMDDYFKHITLPYGKFAVDVFGDPTMDQEILTELDYDLAFTSAQLANLENRLPLGQDSNTSAFPSDGLPPISANVIRSHNRLVQSPAITYIIISILGPVFIFHLFVLIAKAAGRLGLRSQTLINENALVPKGFSSLGMMAALFHGTNAAKYIPANAHKLPSHEIHKMMEGVRFRMGWFMKESDQTLHYTIAVLDDEDFTFMGSKAEMTAMGRHRARAD
ncbi:hypothetical protein CcaCcLH18_12915 [Colletotrichum camelliae]|nr:hypothetical protein CcaCcLH18_12915 [Colletotrichum camelliae]